MYYQEKSLMCKYEEIEGWRLSNGKTIRKIKKAVHEKMYGLLLITFPNLMQ